jgi:hypothetical protein
MDFVEVVIDRPIEVDRDDVEDELGIALGDMGSITGAGTGEDRSNLDIDIDPATDRSMALGVIFEVLGTLVGDAARVRPGDGEEWLRPSEWKG